LQIVQNSVLLYYILSVPNRYSMITLRGVVSVSTAGFNSDYVTWKNWEADQFGRFSLLDARYFALETGIRAVPQARVLEIGFGNGAFLGWLHNQGIEVYAVEANPALVAQATRLLGGGRAFAALEAAELTPFAGTFSHVIAFDVMEHVPLENVVPMLTRIRELLRPGGRCVLRFPNGDSPFGRINQHGDPTHVTTLGAERIAFLARRAVLEVQAVRAPALPCHGVGLLRGARRLGILVSRGIIERVVGTLYFGGRRIPMDPNYTAVLRRPEALGVDRATGAA